MPRWRGGSGGGEVVVAEWDGGWGWAEGPQRGGHGKGVLAAAGVDHSWPGGQAGWLTGGRADGRTGGPPGLHEGVEYGRRIEIQRSILAVLQCEA